MIPCRLSMARISISSSLHGETEARCAFRMAAISAASGVRVATVTRVASAPVTSTAPGFGTMLWIRDRTSERLSKRTSTTDPIGMRANCAVSPSSAPLRSAMSASTREALFADTCSRSHTVQAADVWPAAATRQPCSAANSTAATNSQLRTLPSTTRWRDNVSGSKGRAGSCRVPLDRLLEPDWKRMLRRPLVRTRLSPETIRTHGRIEKQAGRGLRREFEACIALALSGRHCSLERTFHPQCG